MRMNTPRAFWLAFFLTLAVVVPLLGSFALWSVWQQADQALRAAQSTSGLRIQVPTGENTFTMLAVVAGEEPAFVLVRPDAAGGELAVWTVPADSVVRTASGSYTTLRDCYTDAGPGRAAEALAGTLGIEVRYYLAATRQGWGTIGDGLGQVRVNLDGVAAAASLARAGLADDPVAQLAPAKLDELLEKLGCESPESDGVRAAVWLAAARQKAEQLPTVLPDGIRAAGGLLTNMTALDINTLAQTLEFWVNGQGEVDGGVLPGEWNARDGRYEFTDETLTFAAERLGAADAGTGESGESRPRE
ncbi:MAG TPA: hypothetical protein IAA46_11435 [Candidatus Gemmiger avium]|nr:hypothetical protein [Candidatus Gemmiger avium]